MSIFSEYLLPKILDISNAYTQNIHDCLKDAIGSIEEFEQEVQNKPTVRDRTRDKHAMTTLQSINENDDEPVKSNSSETSSESTESKRPKKRSKDEVDWAKSPEVEKRLKRNASVKAQANITKHVNVNLTQKLRRNGSIDKTSKKPQKEDKENAEPLPLVQVKLEKISLPPEVMDMGSIILDTPISVPMKQEPDDIAMPPPNVIPIPKPRKAIQKQKSDEEKSSGEESSKRTSTRTRKQTDSTAQTATSRSLRASSRAKATEEEPTEAKPKRSRTKKVTESSSDNDKNKPESVVENGTASPVEKPRPKRTRRGQNAIEKEQEKQVQHEQAKEQETEKEQVEEIQIITTPKEERISEPVTQSPLLPMKKDKKVTKYNESSQFEKTKIIDEVNGDQTVVLHNGVYDHEPVTPKNVHHMNETVVIEKCNETFVLDKPHVMNGTVVLEKAPQANITEDNSLITDDSDTIEHTPPPKQPPQPTSAVKERVQQFEELATRVTRTKTRAMAKKEEPTENQTPPDKVIPKAIISTDTLTKMNNMIFNGKTSTAISSASKPRITKSQIPQSTGKLSSTTRNKEEAQEDARRKKEALLEAKKEQQRKKREEKMAAAAAAREAAERERKAVIEAALKERLEKQAQVDLGKIEKLKEAERKKQELARKVAETEERRKLEEQARQQKLAEEQKRAGDRKKQLQEAEANKKEAALMEKEMERRQREFKERQKMKQRMEGDKIHTPFKFPTTPLPPLPPAHMDDGFEFLVSDEDAEPIHRPPPLWASVKTRSKQLMVQAYTQPAVLDKFFNVRVYSPDLREIFPNIERKQLKRTSSAVWRTPPSLRTLPAVNE